MPIKIKSLDILESERSKQNIKHLHDGQSEEGYFQIKFFKQKQDNDNLTQIENFRGVNL